MSIRSIPLLVGPVLLAATFTGCSGTPTAPVLDLRFDTYKHLFATIDGADTVVVYEGLPSVWSEEDLFRQEKATKAPVAFADDLFYPAPLEVDGDDVKALKSILREAGNFTPHVSNKCDFHADFGVEWTSGTTHRCLLCFTCREVKIYTAANRGLLCSMAKEARSRLIAILKPYRKSRPGKLHWGE